MANRKLFSKYGADVTEAPNLAQVQLDSYKWFLDEGLRELLREISPIKDWTEKEFELNFLDYVLENPKFNEQTAREKNLTFEAPLRIKLSSSTKKPVKPRSRSFIWEIFP